MREQYWEGRGVGGGVGGFSGKTGIPTTLQSSRHACKIDMRGKVLRPRGVPSAFIGDAYLMSQKLQGKTGRMGRVGGAMPALIRCKGVRAFRESDGPPKATLGPHAYLHDASKR